MFVFVRGILNSRDGEFVKFFFIERQKIKDSYVKFRENVRIFIFDRFVRFYIYGFSIIRRFNVWDSDDDDDFGLIDYINLR